MLPLYKIGALLTVLGVLLGLHYVDKQYAVDRAYIKGQSSVSVIYQKRLNKAVEDTENVIREINVSSDKLIYEKNVQITSLNSKLSDALIRLQQRPKRPISTTDNTNTQTTNTTCTGAFLAREDAEFLTREAATSDRLAAERSYYYNEYENLRLSLIKLNSQRN